MTLGQAWAIQVGDVPNFRLREQRLSPVRTERLGTLIINGSILLCSVEKSSTPLRAHIAPTKWLRRRRPEPRTTRLYDHGAQCQRCVLSKDCPYHTRKGYCQPHDGGERENPAKIPSQCAHPNKVAQGRLSRMANLRRFDRNGRIFGSWCRLRAGPTGEAYGLEREVRLASSRAGGRDDPRSGAA